MHKEMQTILSKFYNDMSGFDSQVHFKSCFISIEW